MFAQRYSITIESHRRTMTMALGKRKDQQQEMWVATASLPKSQGHVF
jgi:hypothetical protein